jgi:hypothetical protein
VTNDRRQDHELRDLLLSRKEGTIAADGIARIDELVCNDASLLRMYIEYARVFSDLRLGLTDDRIDATLSRLLGVDESNHDVASRDVIDANHRQRSSQDRTTTASAADDLRLFSAPVDPFSSAPLPVHGDTLRNTTGYLVSGWPVAYLVATVIFGIGLIVGALVQVSQPVPYVGPRGLGEAPSHQSSIPNSSSIIARVTGMVDCVWEGSGFRVHGGRAEDQKSEIINQKSAVYLGDRLALRSGLLEITYDTGAKVTLQGPVTYEVESPIGGYLFLGKLTAKLEKKSEVGGQRPEPANQKSPDLCPLTSDLFAIRTPTAVVTDLGTEFGVEVDKQGNTKSHVFRGSVRFWPIAAGKGNETNAVVLRENESIQTQRPLDAPNGDVLLLRTSVDPRVFARSVHSSIKSSVKTLDLSDIVAGGDGRSLRREHDAAAPGGREDTILEARAQRNDDLYFSATDMIDRVFLPDGEQGAVRLDSANHRFRGFPKPVNKPSGSVCATATGLIGLQPNAGITFDLKAMRDRYPGTRPNRFRSTAFCRRAIGDTTLFQDDFQSDNAGAMPRDAGRVFLPRTAAGNAGNAWICDATDNTLVQLWNNVDPGHPNNDNGVNNYVKVQRDLPSDGKLRAAGWSAAATMNRPLELSFSIWKDSTAPAFAGVDGFAGQTLGGRSLAVYFYPNGTIAYYNGEHDIDTGIYTDTGITYHADAWQDVKIVADMATQTFSLTVEGVTAKNLRWKSGANVLDTIHFGNGQAARGRFFLDNIRLTTVAGLTESQRRGFGQGGQGDIWVFVDGRLRLKRLGIRAEDAAVPVDIEIGPNDRFLTIVSTDGSNGNPTDWAVWENAVLEMVTIDPDGR